MRPEFKDRMIWSMFREERASGMMDKFSTVGTGIDEGRVRELTAGAFLRARRNALIIRGPVFREQELPSQALGQLVS